MQLLGLCESPPILTEEEFVIAQESREWRSQLSDLRTHVEMRLREQKKYVEDCLEGQARASVDHLKSLRQEMVWISKQDKVAEETVKEVMDGFGTLKKDFEKLRGEFKEVRSEVTSMQEKAGYILSWGKSFEQINDMMLQLDEMRTRAIMLPATEAEMEELRKRVDETRVADKGGVTFGGGGGAGAARVSVMDQASPPAPGGRKVSASKGRPDLGAIQEQKQEAAAQKRREEELLARHELYTKHSLMLAVMQKEVTMLRSSIDACRDETTANAEGVKVVRQDMHRTAEAVSVKAGYLALALTSCNDEEKRRIHTLLKDKEKDLDIDGAGIMLYTTKVDKMESGFGEKVDLPTLHFSVELDRSEGKSLGLELSATEGTALTITRIGEGLAHEHNRKVLPPGEPVKVGDRIIQVDEIKGYPALLQKQLELRVHHRIFVERRHQGA